MVEVGGGMMVVVVEVFAYMQQKSTGEAVKFRFMLDGVGVCAWEEFRWLRGIGACFRGRVRNRSNLAVRARSSG